jgi:hypothetical protein
MDSPEKNWTFILEQRTADCHSGGGLMNNLAKSLDSCPAGRHGTKIERAGKSGPYH